MRVRIRLMPGSVPWWYPLWDYKNYTIVFQESQPQTHVPEACNLSFRDNERLLISLLRPIQCPTSRHGHNTLEYSISWNNFECK